MKKLFTFKRLCMLLGILLVASVVLFNSPAYISRRAAGEIAAVKENALATGYENGYRQAKNDAAADFPADRETGEGNAAYASSEPGSAAGLDERAMPPGTDPAFAGAAPKQAVDRSGLTGGTGAEQPAPTTAAPTTAAPTTAAPTTAAPTTAAAPATEAPVRSAIEVYVSRNGIYHSYPSCSGMKHYSTMTVDDAIEAGCRACKKCW